MFSEKQQELVLFLFFKKRITRREQKIYISPIGFYRCITYLRCAGMITSERVPLKNQYIYSLTDKGRLLALWISRLPDNKILVDDYRQRLGEPFLKKFSDTLM